MYHPLNYRYLYCALQVSCYFLDTYDAERVCAGTGFIVSQAGKLHLISNRHVFEAGYSDSAKRQWRISRIEISGRGNNRAYFRYGLNSSVAQFPQAYDEDVGLVPIGELTVLELEGEQHSVIDIALDALADDSYFGSLNAGDFVAFPGWPEWHDRIGRRPILRSGVISSDPVEDYSGPNMRDGARKLAYEGFSFGGSSGSPVFALGCGLKLGDGLQGASYRPPRLIGINAGHLTHFDGTKQHSGISYMFKSTVIRDLVAAVA